MNATKRHLDLFSETLKLAFTDQGSGHPFLLLHGGAGSGSMMGLAGALATNGRAIVPVHPGFDGEPRPDKFARLDDLVLAYLALLERLDLKNVVIVGNSVGGWIAAEMGLRKSPRIAGVVLLDAGGIDTGSPDRALPDLSKASPAERVAMAFHDPKRFAIVPSDPDAAAASARNQQTLRVYAGEPFDPTLRSRLAAMSTPSLLVWGASDRVYDVDYGRLYAKSIPGSRFELVSDAGHLPQIERLEETTRLITGFAGALELP
jgi:pimeloyl-ACP methyl ester carboxylesterase